MLSSLGHLGAGLAYLATARRQHESDQLTAKQLARPADRAFALGLSVTWFGTAGFRFEYEGTVVWIDPYLTRLPLGDLVRRRVVPPSIDAIAHFVDRADAVLVGHTHFDHALDVPAISRLHGSRVYGSHSLQHLMGLHGLADRAVVAVPHSMYEVGPFRFKFVPSIHSKLQLGLRIPYSGELTCEHLDEMTPQAYRCGQVFGIYLEVAGLRFYHQGSADLLDDEIRDKHVDVFLCGASGRRFTANYLPRILRALEPKLVVPTHYDDFFVPLASSGPTKFSFNVNLTGFADEAHAASRDLPVQTLMVGVPI